MSDQLPFDKDTALLQLDGDLELLQELAEIFLDDSPRLLQEIRDSVSGGDSTALRSAAHTFKGAVSNFAAKPCVAAALALEKIGESGDLSDASSALATLEEAAVEFLSAIQSLQE